MTYWPLLFSFTLLAVLIVTNINNFKGNKLCWIESKTQSIDSEQQQKDFQVKFRPLWHCMMTAPQKLRTLLSLTVMNRIARNFLSPIEMMNNLRVEMIRPTQLEHPKLPTIFMEKLDLISILPKKDSFSNFAYHGKKRTYDILLLLTTKRLPAFYDFRCLNVAVIKIIKICIIF